MSGPATTGGLKCIDCGDSIAGCLARLGSLRCHDCREQPGRGLRGRRERTSG